ncbi:MAG: PAS domain-containing protein [Candidatus Eremiobacteraeota bacterium]|nr:PAS domain-containing protein [Candidatus Eremiobacteraeota bacterium]
MAVPTFKPTGVERRFGDDEIIVSKTDPKGIITYANPVFQRVAGYTEKELLGQAHNLIRHPAMPRSVFALLWDTIAAGNEIFAYVINMCKGGDHYWVLAHVSPTFGPDHKTIVGYHSSRRSPARAAIGAVEPIYAAILAEEQKVSNPKQQVQVGLNFVTQFLHSQGQSYEEFLFSVVAATAAA